MRRIALGRQALEKGLEVSRNPRARVKAAPGAWLFSLRARLQRLHKLLLDGASKAGFSSNLWTCARVAQVIREWFEVEYHPSHVWKILRKLGWSCQKPERRARERNESQAAYQPSVF